MQDDYLLAIIKEADLMKIMRRLRNRVVCATAPVMAKVNEVLPAVVTAGPLEPHHLVLAQDLHTHTPVHKKLPIRRQLLTQSITHDLQAIHLL